MRKEQSIKTNNNQMKEKGMKSRFIHFKKRFVPALSGALASYGMQEKRDLHYLLLNGRRIEKR